MPETRYERIIEAFGCKGYFVETKSELQEALRKAFKETTEKKKPVLVNVMIDSTAGRKPQVNSFFLSLSFFVPSFLSFLSHSFFLFYLFFKGLFLAHAIQNVNDYIHKNHQRNTRQQNTLTGKRTQYFGPVQTSTYSCTKSNHIKNYGHTSRLYQSVHEKFQTSEHGLHYIFY